MILVDTSVWVQHLRLGTSRLATLLEETRVLTHPLVIGELALGRLVNRAEILELLGNLPSLTAASQEDVLALIEQRELASTGIGWIDAHLIAAALLHDATLWTLDHRLGSVAERLEIAPN